MLLREAKEKIAYWFAGLGLAQRPARDWHDLTWYIELAQDDDVLMPHMVHRVIDGPGV
jgi:hypothetical protein